MRYERWRSHTGVLNYKTEIYGGYWIIKQKSVFMKEADVTKLPKKSNYKTFFVL